ncbi:MAG: HNH endonuclease [Dysosmobacter sp.]
MTANISNAMRKAIYARDHYRCAICDSARGLQIHHVIPRSQGGSNRPENLITLCMYCHGVIHGTRFPEMPEWMDREELNQVAVEYVADYYAGSWWPWELSYAELLEREEKEREEGG